MIHFRLREMRDRYAPSSGERFTYELLAARTGLSRATIESMATRPGYNARLATIERVCRALHCQPGDLLELSAPSSDRSHSRKGK